MSEVKKPSKTTTSSTNKSTKTSKKTTTGTTKSTTKIVAKEENNMKKATKLTTKKTTTVSKEVDTKNLEKGISDIYSIVHSHICNINKKYSKGIESYSIEEITAYVKAHKLEKMATQLGTLHNTLVDNAIEAYKQAKQEKRDNERKYIKDENDNKDTAKKHEERLQNEYDTAKTEEERLCKLITRIVLDIKKGGE